MLPDGYGALIQKGSMFGYHTHNFKEPGHGPKTNDEMPLGFFSFAEVSTTGGTSTGSQLIGTSRYVKLWI